MARMPPAARGFVLAGAVGEPARADCWTDRAEAVDRDVGAAPAPGPTAMGAEGVFPAGTDRSGATGIRCATGPPLDEPNRPARVGCSGSAGDRVASVNARESRLLPAAGSSTAGDGAPVNDGFCQVGRRPPNPASTTPARAPPTARWICGR
ncbi:hypothetical protein [Streptomyces melanogenes]|uniref:Uncharacterized protein n=1 Tax=Streptomyces melanogenes TaxID=67326 RepID=A0ABZ1XCK1_9ACTN|nr:hypothetical protein [Streptomyces melanogenes]